MRDYRVVAVMAGLIAMPLVCAPAASAATMRTSAARDGAKLNADDTRMLEQAINQALEQRKSGAVTTWANSATSRAGQATVTHIYLRGDQPCGMVEHVFTKGGGRHYVLPYCRQPDGAWRIQY